MKTTYKGFNIEECEGLNYVPKAPKIQFYDPDDCDGRMFFANSIDEAKEIIDEEKMDKITLEHLSAYLPHEVQFISELDKPYEEYGKQPIWTLNGVHELFGDYSILTKENKDSYAISKCKLMLRSIDSLKGGEYKQLGINPAWYGLREWAIGQVQMTVWEYNKLLSMRVDVFGLIPRGLAVEIKEVHNG